MDAPDDGACFILERFKRVALNAVATLDYNAECRRLTADANGRGESSFTVDVVTLTRLVADLSAVMRKRGTPGAKAAVIARQFVDDLGAVRSEEWHRLRAGIVARLGEFEGAVAQFIAPPPKPAPAGTQAEAVVWRAAGIVTPGMPEARAQAKTGAGRSGVKGSADSDATTKMIAALTKHHGYAEDSCLVDKPIDSNELARQATVSKSTASMFFKNKFTSHDGYKIACRDKTTLLASLKLLNGEFAPHLLLRPDAGATNHDE